MTKPICDNCGSQDVVAVYGLGEDQRVPEHRMQEVLTSGAFEFVAYCDECEREEMGRDE